MCASQSYYNEFLMSIPIIWLWYTKNMDIFTIHMVKIMQKKYYDNNMFTKRTCGTNNIIFKLIIVQRGFINNKDVFDRYLLL